ncbi:CGNR zinc finger domain-containing protein [Bradyrhizobium sp. SZCCHNR2032]|uniref:CGNR zinc finger domain-containing protein n=3 Tax=Bradyrhizobium TaxID=374 RepID=UPI002916703C|nr:CGNR zinc finger domain-containing protein [Bradyrhizobium sp. SZCCHNR2032]
MGTSSVTTPLKLLYRILLPSTAKAALLVSMSRQSRKFKVPDELANVYDFANSLDLRHFTRFGVQHPQADELATPADLARWLAERALMPAPARITSALFDEALQLRQALRDYLQCEPAGRRSDRAVSEALTAALAGFPLHVEMREEGGTVLSGMRKDALAGLSTIAIELHDGNVRGTLDRLKMCASDECRRVFYDRSKPSTRRWCMSDLCGNRMKTRAYRERLRQTNASS